MSISPCRLCPRLCGADRVGGKRGACGAGADVLVARAALHYWEEPPISGESGSGTVFFSGCPLGCVYCQNGAISGGGAGIPVSEASLAQTFLGLQAAGAMNLNCVTPTHYTPQIVAAIRAARSQGLGLPVVWNTSGYERVETLRALEGTVDVYLADFKYAASDQAGRYSHAPDYPDVALAAVGEMALQTGPPRFDVFEGASGPQDRMAGGVIVRHLLLPGGLAESKRAIAALFARFGDSVLYSIMNQYTPVAPEAVMRRFPELARPVPQEDYERLLDFADSLGMEDYFWQDGPAAAESFVPAWDGEGVVPA